MTLLLKTRLNQFTTLNKKYRIENPNRLVFEKNNLSGLVHWLN